MYDLRRVLVATDGSDHGMTALVSGVSCARLSKAKLDVVAVAEAILMPLGIETGVKDETVAENLQIEVERQLEEAGATDAQLHVRKGLAAPTITQVAEELEVDLIIVGAHPRPTVARFLVGSTAERVLRLAHRPILVATEARHEPFHRILVAVDLSSQSLRVLDVAVAMSVQCGAELKVVYVQDRLTPMLLEAALFDEKESRHHARAELSKAMGKVSLPSELMVSREVREGHAGHEILHAADEWGAELIVMGSHGFGFFNRLLLGSISIYVLRHGHRATLVVPRASERGAE
jgi:nucleotide-binding universal stress UspA family protein